MKDQIMYHTALFSKLSIFGIFLWHFILTGPSIIWHGLASLYHRIHSVPPVIPTLSNKDVIVFVHGRGGHHSNFNTLMSNLKRHLSHELIAIDLGHNQYTTIDTDVSVLSAAMKSLENCRITLIGLSKGGLTAMRYATTMKDPRIRNIITISSPLHGTLATKFLISSCMANKELGYKSELTQEIAANISDNYNIYHIVPRYDHIIIPTSSTYYNTTIKDRIYRYEGYYSHLGISHNSNIAKVIVSWLVNNGY